MAFSNVRGVSNVSDVGNPVQRAIDEIYEQYGDRVTIKNKSLAKFGRFANLGTSVATVQEHGGTETYLTDNLIDVAVSSDAGDTQPIRIEGHTIDGSGNLTFVTQDVTLTGDTNASLTTPLARATRLINLGTADFAGTVKVVDATSPSTIYVQATGVQANGRTYNRSQKASTSISQNDYWIITKVFGAVLKKTTASVDFSIQVKSTTGVSQELYAFDGASASPNVPHNLEVPIIVPPNSDVSLDAVASTTAVEVIGRISGYLALKNG